MASVQWERYLYKEHSLVALNVGKNVQLFDVLVKREKEGKHPVLTKTGTLLGIQSSSGTNWEKTAAKIDAFLKGSLKKKDEAGIVERHMDGDYQCITNQASNVIIKLLKLLNLGGGQSEGLFCEANNVQTERIDSGLKETLFCCKPPLWVPNLERIALEQPVPSKNGLTEFWVVVEVKYCTELTIELDVESSGNVDLSLPEELTRLSVPVNIGGGIKVSKTSAEMVVAKGSKVPIGFKAVRLVYDKDGNLQQMVSGGERIRPRFRDHGDHPVDPDKFPSYHMGGLFVDEAQELLECLEFE